MRNHYIVHTCGRALTDCLASLDSPPLATLWISAAARAAQALRRGDGESAVRGDEESLTRMRNTGFDFRAVTMEVCMNATMCVML